MITCTGWDHGEQSGASSAEPAWGSPDHTPHTHSPALFHASAHGREAHWDKQSLDHTPCSWRCGKVIRKGIRGKTASSKPAKNISLPVWLHIAVLHHVSLQVAGLGEGLVAHLTFVRPHALVCEQMCVQVAQLLKQLST